MSSYSQNPTAFYLKLCTGYYDELINSGRRDMAAAFVEYSRDLDRGRVFKFQDYANYWFSDYAKKPKAYQWISKFKIAIEAFKKASEKTFVKNPFEPKLHEDATVFEPELNSSDTQNTDATDVLEISVEPKFNEDATVFQPDLNISINSKINKSIIKKKEKEKEQTHPAPDWMRQEDLDLWVGYRLERGLSINKHTIKIQLETLQKLVQAGYQPTEIIKYAIERVWGTFYPPSESSSKSIALAGSAGRVSTSFEQERRDVRSNGEAIATAFQAKGHRNILHFLEKRDQEEGVA